MVALNLYGIYYLHADPDLTIYDYTDAGGELIVNCGGTWSLQLGGKATLGLKDLTATEIYLGSQLGF